MKTIQKLNYKGFTKLPMKELVKTGSLKNEIIVTTPHKGDVYIPVIEGWLFKTEKDGENIISQIQWLEYESKEYLLKEWLKKLK